MDSWPRLQLRDAVRATVAEDINSLVANDYRHKNQPFSCSLAVSRFDHSSTPHPLLAATRYATPQRSTCRLSWIGRIDALLCHTAQ